MLVSVRAGRCLMLSLIAIDDNQGQNTQYNKLSTRTEYVSFDETYGNY